MTDKASIRPDMVRELEWKYHPMPGFKCELAKAHSFRTGYSVDDHDHYFTVNTEDGFLGDHIYGEKFPTGDAAKAAAQADYASRITSALSPAFLARIEAIEAKNALARKALKIADKAIQPLVDAVYNDNGDMTVNIPYLDAEQCITGYFASKAITRARTTLQEPEDGERQGDET